MKDGTIPSEKDGHQRLIRRCDLPRKPGHGVLKLETGEPDLAGEVLARRGLAVHQPERKENDVA